MFGLRITNNDTDEGAADERRQVSSRFNVRYRGDVQVAPKMVAIRQKFTLPQSNASDTGGSMIDVIAFVIHCKQHNRLATYSIKSSVDELLRIQLPNNLKCLKRVIYYVALVPPTKKDSGSGQRFQCCRNTSQLTWVDVHHLGDNQFEGTTWGPELVQYSRVVLENFSGFTERISEISLDEVYYYVPRDPPRNVEEKLLLELNVKEKLIETLYIDFLEHCYPAITLPFGSFKHYMFKFGFEYNDHSLSPLFIAFNYERNGYISFDELLMGLACIDPSQIHLSLL